MTIKFHKGMKKTLFAVAALAFAAVSCQKELSSNDSSLQGGEVYTYTLGGNQAEGESSKIGLGADRTVKACLWRTGDEIAAYSLGGVNSGSAVLTSGEDSQIGTFTLTTTLAPGEKTRLVYPASAAFGQGVVPTVQMQPKTKEIDLSSCTYAYSDELTLDSNSEVQFSLHHAVAVVRVEVKSADEYNGWKLRGIRLRTPGTPLSGNFTIDYSTGVVTPGSDAADYVQMDLKSGVLGSIGTGVNYLLCTALPTPASTVILAELYVQNAGNTEQRRIPVRFKGQLMAGRVNVITIDNLSAADICTKDDYYAKWLKGEEFTIGDLVVNKTNFPTAKLYSLSEINYTKFGEAGLKFIDDPAFGTLDLTPFSTNQAITNSGKTASVIVGRYAASEMQTTIQTVEMRTFVDLSWMNIKLVGSGITGTNASGIQHMFSKQSTDTKATALRLQDCTVDARTCTLGVIGDQNGNGTNYSAPYININVDNCVVINPMQATAGAGLSFYRHYKYLVAAGGTDIARTLTLHNNVFMWPSAVSGDNTCIVNLMNSSDDGSSPLLKFDITNNIIYNLCPAAVIRYAGKETPSFDDNSVFNKNVIYAVNNDYLNGATAKVFYAPGTPNKLGTARDNYCSADNCHKKAASDKVAFSMWSVKTAGNNRLVQDINPFSAESNPATGYFVIDPSNTDISSRAAGATPKTFVKK